METRSNSISIRNAHDLSELTKKILTLLHLNLECLVAMSQGMAAFSDMPIGDVIDGEMCYIRSSSTAIPGIQNNTLSSMHLLKQRIQVQHVPGGRMIYIQCRRPPGPDSEVMSQAQGLSWVVLT